VFCMMFACVFVVVVTGNHNKKTAKKTKKKEEERRRRKYTTNTSTQVTIGTLLLHGGYGVEPDHGRAMQYFQRAAEMGVYVCVVFVCW